MTTKELEKMITKNHTGKMEGMHSLSTSCMKNAICRKRMKDGNSICSKCFSAAMHKRYTTLAKKLEKNTEILTSEVYPVELFPVVNVAYFRLESFGDLGNVTQAINYIHFAKRNPQTMFALWTKNPRLLALALETESKPENMIIIYSSPIINKQASAHYTNRYPFIDHVFTVYSKEYATENNIDINCGARHCLSCQRCYTTTTEVYINELVK